MQSIKRKIYFSTWLVYLFAADAAAVFGADDPFETATTKTNEFTDYLSGNFAVALCTVVIAVAAIACMLNKLRMDWTLRICAGAIVMASAAKIAEWLFA